MAPKPKKPGNEPGELGDMSQIITDLNRNLARFRTLILKYEQRNEELQSKYDNLDKDTADIISYLKKTFHKKNEENGELKDRVKDFEELIEKETKEFKATINELLYNFDVMKVQLSSENKLLAGQINTREEMRAIRDDMMQRFECQEQAFKNQEEKYKKLIYDTDKKVVIEKDRLKKEMDGKLLRLSQDFQDASECRIATSTGRVIKENSALNNKFDELLFTQAKLAEQNEKFKEDNLFAQCALELVEAERDEAISISNAKLKLIDKLTKAYREIKKNQALHQFTLQEHERLQATVQKLTKANENLTLKKRILEQKLNNVMDQEKTQIVTTANLTNQCNRYKKILKEVTSAIQTTRAIKTDEKASADPAYEILQRKIVLKNILGIINRHKYSVQVESVESLLSFADIYEKGNLGFAPKTLPGKPSRMSASSDISFKTPKRSSVSMLSLESSVISLKTWDSQMSIIRKTKEGSVTISTASIPSLTVTSKHSTPNLSKPESIGSSQALTGVEIRSLSDTRRNVDLKLKTDSKELPIDSIAEDKAVEDEVHAEIGTPEEGTTVEVSEIDGEPADKTINNDAATDDQHAATDEQNAATDEQDKEILINQDQEKQ